MSGVKYDSGKLRYSLLPWVAITAIVKVLEFGATKKYKIDSWQDLADGERRYFDAAMRHLIAHRRGERLDSESGLSHLSHAACNLVFLIWLDEDKDNGQSKSKL